jgi:hypothetical protein
MSPDSEPKTKAQWAQWVRLRGVGLVVLFGSFRVFDYATFWASIVIAGCVLGVRERDIRIVDRFSNPPMAGEIDQIRTGRTVLLAGVLTGVLAGFGQVSPLCALLGLSYLIMCLFIDRASFGRTHASIPT